MKRALLLKLFPRTDKQNPQIRIENFEQDWKNYQLADITNRVKGNDGRLELPTLTISANRGWMDQKERFSNNIAGNEQKNYTLLKKGQLSYNHGNSKFAKYGVVVELNNFEEALVPKIYHSFETNYLSNSTFIHYMFETKRTDKELRKLVSSGARMDGLLNINYEDFSHINVKVPKIEEQVEIAKLMKDFDYDIDRLSKELDILQKMKKGFLQKLFPKGE